MDVDENFILHLICYYLEFKCLTYCVQPSDTFQFTTQHLKVLLICNAQEELFIFYINIYLFYGFFPLSGFSNISYMIVKFVACTVLFICIFVERFFPKLAAIFIFKVLLHSRVVQSI